MLMAKKDKYLLHRFQIQNDKYIWKHILETVDDYGPIFHMDYSGNIQATPKYEPQSAYFSKRQFSLYCTVMHCEGDSNKFVCHLSDDLSHDSVFTMAVVKDLTTKFAPDHTIVRFKMDNCSTQFKCKYVFYQWRELSMNLGKTFIIYFGVSGHGKGLVDAMSGFGVKTPMRKAIVTDNYFFNTTKQLTEFLNSLDFESDCEYYFFDKFERKPKTSIYLFFIQMVPYSSKKIFVVVKIV